MMYRSLKPIGCEVILRALATVSGVEGVGRTSAAVHLFTRHGDEFAAWRIFTTIDGTCVKKAGGSAGFYDETVREKINEIIEALRNAK